ncbi:MAG: HlyD family efflux transporter periplasmic adaptor subunit [Acidobacteria bacterium]|nr:HlyD family efflux transporter periplasmic adaptor subunit [Acidobacteriota bacterium]
MPSQTGVGASAAIGSTSTSATTGAGGLNALGSQAGPVSNSGLDAQSSTSSLGAQRGSTNRFQPRPPRQSSSSRRSGGGDNAMAGGIGSTGGNLISSGMRGGGGGGGSGAGMSGGFGGVGGGEFMLILLEVAKPGSRVRKGDIVAEFDRQYQERRLDDYRASVIQLEANVKKLKADLMVAKEAHAQLVRTARASLEKARLDLKTVEVRSAIEAEKFRLVAEEADAHYGQSLKEVALVETSHRAQLRATEIDRDQAKIELERAEKNINRMIVRAPIDGIVVMQSIWRGGDMGQVQQGDQIPPGMFFMSIVDPSSMVINATVNQVDSEMLRLGMKAVARLDAYPGLELPASIQGIAAMARTGGWRASFVREIPVRLKLDRIDPRVIPDLSASAEILLSSEPRAAVLPLAAVFREPDGERPFVFVQSPAGWQRREVELGLSNNIAVAARSGVKPGDVVATEKPGSGNVQRDPA